MTWPLALRDVTNVRMTWQRMLCDVIHSRMTSPMGGAAAMDAAAAAADEAALVVDKVAAAVARNGPAFEALLREKQHGNPKYAFLYGGAYADRYALALQRERAGTARPASPPGSGPPAVLTWPAAGLAAPHNSAGCRSAMASRAGANLYRRPGGTSPAGADAGRGRAARRTGPGAQQRGGGGADGRT